MRLEFLQLEEQIKSICQSKPVYYIVNPGNWGDALIRMGTLKFFKEIGLDYKEIEFKKRNLIIPFLKGETVIYGGGGGWCRHWNHSHRHVSKLNTRFNVIVLPSTYEKNRFLPNVTFFSRDKFESLQNMPDSLFCHDMAFFINPVSSPKGCGPGYFFRTDAESSGKIKLPPGNYDISRSGTHFSDLDPFFEELSKYEIIYTDRLHVAIASCLLSKEVHLFSSSYFKIEAVYKSSIKEYFDNVYFHEDYNF